MKTVSVWNPKGGRGKSLVAINLAAVVVLALKQRGAFEIRASGIFSRADNDYRTIYDPALNGAYGVRERRQEFSAILAAVLQNQQRKDLNDAQT